MPMRMGGSRVVLQLARRRSRRRNRMGVSVKKEGDFLQCISLKWTVWDVCW